jgi:hypothetical protein
MKASEKLNMYSIWKKLVFHIWAHILCIEDTSYSGFSTLSYNCHCTTNRVPLLSQYSVLHMALQYHLCSLLSHNSLVRCPLQSHSCSTILPVVPLPSHNSAVRVFAVLLLLFYCSLFSFVREDQYFTNSACSVTSVLVHNLIILS